MRTARSDKSKTHRIEWSQTSNYKIKRITSAEWVRKKKVSVNMHGYLASVLLQHLFQRSKQEEARIIDTRLDYKPRSTSYEQHR